MKTRQEMIESKMLAEITERFWSRSRRTCVAGGVEKKIFLIGRFALVEIYITQTRAEGTPLDSEVAFGFVRRGVTVILRGGRWLLVR